MMRPAASKVRRLHDNDTLPFSSFFFRILAGSTVNRQKLRHFRFWDNSNEHSD